MSDRDPTGDEDRFIFGHHFRQRPSGMDTGQPESCDEGYGNFLHDVPFIGISASRMRLGRHDAAFAIMRQLSEVSLPLCQRPLQGLAFTTVGVDFLCPPDDREDTQPHQSLDSHFLTP